MLRILKRVLAHFIGLHALSYALQNIANINEAHAALGCVISGADQTAYPHTLFFRGGSSALYWAALILVLIGEFSVAFFGMKGG